MKTNTLVLLIHLLVFQSLTAQLSQETLERASKHYPAVEDTLKRNALAFLYQHLPSHFSNDMRWQTKQGQPIDFDETRYAGMPAAMAAFDSLKALTSLEAVAIVYPDEMAVTDSLLVDNVEWAFRAWQHSWAKDLPFSLFCEYLLPYRITTEPVRPWRALYDSIFKPVIDSVQPGDRLEACQSINNKLAGLFLNTYHIANRQEPLPLLSPTQLVLRKQGDCSDMVNFGVYAFRSQGIPAAVDFVPYWPTSSGRHYWNALIRDNGHSVLFMAGEQNPGEYFLPREFGKVYRYMFSIQPDAIANQIPKDSIPDGPLRSPHIMDVSHEYGETDTLYLKPKHTGHKAVFLCVFNNHRWSPVAGAVKDKTGKVVFHKMGRGVVYMPMYYDGKQLVAAGDPVVLDTNRKTRILSPQTGRKTNFTMKQQDNYLLYRPGKTYKLMIWDGTWKQITEKTAPEGATELAFPGIPSDALYLLVPEYSRGKERVFSLHPQTGERQWW